jgi:hypothetical protein
MSTADHSGYNLFAYALAILLHIYNSLITASFNEMWNHV